MANSRLEEIRKIRLDKLAKLVSLGINPYPASYSLSTIPVSEALTKQGQSATIAGRLWKIREHGQLVFADLRDSTGQIQLMFQEKILPSQFSILKLLDMGDFLGVSGKVITTAAGQITIDVVSYELLSKSLRPLPDDWFGLTDEETRFRQRYVDLLLNDKVRQVFLTRTKIVNLLRQHLNTQGFIEVETPVLQPIYGGTVAKPFVTHHHELDTDLYLRIADELYLKRLIVGGFDKVYEIGRDFRNEGVDRSHNPEFTMLEFYWAYSDYEKLMVFTEKLLSDIVKEVVGSYQLTYQNQALDFTPPWPRLSYRDVILKYSGIDINIANTENLLKSAITEKFPQIKTTKVAGFGNLMDLLYKHTSRPNLTGPLFLTDRPTDFVALAKRLPDDPTKTASFQLLVCGMEMLTAYNELNDPQDQADRWHQSEETGGEEHETYDADYIRALEYGMPPTAGWGMGIDRFVAVLTNQSSLKDTILFPTLRPENQTVKTTQSSGDFTITSPVKEKFPGISYAYVIIKNISIKKTHPELEDLKIQIVDSKKSLTADEISSIKSISSYRDIFKQTGVDYHSRRPSPEALLRRISQGKNLYTINTAVDAYNVAVLETGIGLGGFNYDHIVLPVTLRFSASGEEIHLLGDDSASLTKEGELVYADAEKLITLDLNYRDIDQTKITENTTNLILFADGGPGIDPTEVLAALKLGAKYIRQFCGGEVGDYNLVK